MLPNNNPIIIPMIPEKFTNPLQATAYQAVNLECIKIPTSPTSWGISWAKIAIVVEIMALESLSANKTPKTIPSIILCRKSPIKFKYPSAFLFLKSVNDEKVSVSMSIFFNFIVDYCLDNFKSVYWTVDFSGLSLPSVSTILSKFYPSFSGLDLISFDIVSYSWVWTIPKECSIFSKT